MDYKDKIKSYQAPHDPEAWEQMETLMDKQGGTNSDTSSSRYWSGITSKYLLLVTGFIITIGLGVFMLNNDVKSTIAEENSGTYIGEETLSSSTLTKEKLRTQRDVQSSETPNTDKEDHTDDKSIARADSSRATHGAEYVESSVAKSENSYAQNPSNRKSNAVIHDHNEDDIFVDSRFPEASLTQHFNTSNTNYPKKDRLSTSIVRTSSDFQYQELSTPLSGFVNPAGIGSPQIPLLTYQRTHDIDGKIMLPQTSSKKKKDKRNSIGLNVYRMVHPVAISTSTFYGWGAEISYQYELFDFLRSGLEIGHHVCSELNRYNIDPSVYGSIRAYRLGINTDYIPLHRKKLSPTIGFNYGIESEYEFKRASYAEDSGIRFRHDVQNVGESYLDLGAGLQYQIGGGILLFDARFDVVQEGSYRFRAGYKYIF